MMMMVVRIVVVLSNDSYIDDISDCDDSNDDVYADGCG